MAGFSLIDRMSQRTSGAGALPRELCRSAQDPPTGPRHRASCFSSSKRSGFLDFLSAV
jgi:hypothetical protein